MRGSLDEFEVKIRRYERTCGEVLSDRVKIAVGYASEVPMSNHSRRATLRTAFGAQMEHAGQKMVENENGDGGLVNVNFGLDQLVGGGRRVAETWNDCVMQAMVGDIRTLCGKPCRKRLDLGDPTPLIDEVYVGCTQREAKVDLQAVQSFRDHTATTFSPRSSDFLNSFSFK